MLITNLFLNARKSRISSADAHEPTTASRKQLQLLSPRDGSMDANNVSLDLRENYVVSTNSMSRFPFQVSNFLLASFDVIRKCQYVIMGDRHIRQGVLGRCEGHKRVKM